MAKVKQQPAPPAPTVLPPTSLVQVSVASGFSPASLELAFPPMPYAPFPQQVPNYTYNSTTRLLTFGLAPGAQADLRYVGTSTRPASAPVRLVGPPATALTVGGGLFIHEAPDYEVQPGDVVTLFVNPGTFQIMLEAPGKPTIALKTVSQGPYTRTVQIPGSYLLAEYKLYLRQGLFISEAVYLNRPRCKALRTDEVLGGCRFAFHGVNLRLNMGSPTLRFRTSAGAYHSATMTAAKSHFYGFEAVPTLPDTLAEQLVTPLFSNGLPGSTEVELPPVRVVTRTADPYGINEAYVHRITNVTVDAPISAGDSTAAIRAAYTQLATQSPTGGYVRLVPGAGGSEAKVRTQTGNDAPLEPTGPVLFVGATSDVTLSYGAPGDPVSTYPALVYWKASQNIGFANLKVKNYNANGAFWRVMGFDKDVTRFICHNTSLSLPGTQGLDFAGHKFKYIHFTNSTITNAYTGVYKETFGPVTISNFEYVSFDNCSTSHALGQNSFHDGFGVWMANNNLECDASQYAQIKANAPDPSKRQARQVSVDFVRGVYLWNNICTTKGTPESVTDREVYLLSEGGGPAQRANGHAKVAAYSGTSLTLASTAFLTKMDLYGKGANITIIDGPGTGQKNTIASISGTQIVLEKPFNVPPTSASTIAINNYALVDATVGGGECYDALGSVASLYRSYSENVVIADLKAYRCEGPQVELGQLARSGYGNGVIDFWQYSVARNFTIRRCRIDNGQQTKAAAYVCLTTMNDCFGVPVEQGGGKLRGLTIFGGDVSDNTIISNNNTNLTFPTLNNGSGYNQFGLEGIIVATKNNNANPRPSDLPMRATEGLVLQRNTANRLVTNEAATYLVQQGNTFATQLSLQVDAQAAALSPVTLTGTETLTEAIVAIL